MHTALRGAALAPELEDEAHRSLTERAPVALLLTEGPLHLVRTANPAFGRISGLDPAALAGHPLSAALRGDAESGCVALLDQVFRTGEPAEATGIEHFHAERGARLWDCTAWPVLAGAGQWRRISFEIRDTTEQTIERRRGLEAAREARELNERLLVAGLRMHELADEAAEAVRARDDLVAAVSHDLRSPLTTIALSAAALLRGAPADPARLRRSLERVQQTAEHMRHLIQDLVDGARLGAGTLPVHPEELPIAPLVTEAMAMLAPLAAEKSLAFDVELEGGAGALVARVDRHRMAQALGNLLGNAIKFTPAGGSVTARLACVEGRARISIRDTGPGIAPEDIERLFDRFWQGRGAGRSGAGLGLFITRGIVEAHGGRVAAESQPGAGSVFHLDLPLAAPV